ncbi:MAG: 2-iminoacetate synthase ThiH [Verrucomicrobia bacterium]|nr:2-iminoacetate synthase ThiH [Verrucomicrobiota bacterium]
MSFAKTLLLRTELPTTPAVRAFARLLEPLDDRGLEALAARAQALTRQHFGRVMRLFAPLYLSNECVNNCRYCGFSRDNAILRVTLTRAQVVAEARHLAGQGFRSILLVAGEHPKFVSNGYLADCIRAVREEAGVPGVSLEVGPLETDDYRPLVAAGAEGLVVYQETYHPATYGEMHTAGPKRDFAWRLACPERAYAAGFRRLGVGALFGLWDWKAEALALAAHVEHLLRACWKAQISVSLPRLRPAAGEFVPRFALADRDFVQLLCALRVTFPQVGLVLSTREAPALRDALVPLGVTTLSAGSHTEPGGYTGQGKADLHLTVRGRLVDADLTAKPAGERRATGQFDIADERSPQEIAELLRSRHGLEPVWKDWDDALVEG